MPLRPTHKQRIAKRMLQEQRMSQFQKLNRVDHRPIVVPLNLWLQWYGDGTPKDPGDVCESEVTWCRDQIFAHDVEYVRGDRVNILLQALHGLTMPCTRADYTVGDLDGVVCEIAQNALDEFWHTNKIADSSSAHR